VLLATTEGEILAVIEENRAQKTFRCSTIQHPLGPQQIFFFYNNCNDYYNYYSSRLFRICSNTFLPQFSKTVVQAPMKFDKRRGFFQRNSDRKGSRFSCVLISLSVQCFRWEGITVFVTSLHHVHRQPLIQQLYCTFRCNDDLQTQLIFIFYSTVEPSSSSSSCTCTCTGGNPALYIETTNTA